MSKPAKALLGKTKSQAEAIIRAFDLDPTIWQSFPWRGRIPGQLFDTVILCAGDEPGEEGFIKAFGLLRPGGSIHVL